jgi:hypothetical protein
MIVVPCGKCERMGCGAYHDQCEKYQAYKEERRKLYEYHRQERMKYSVRCGKRRLNDI